MPGHLCQEIGQKLKLQVQYRFAQHSRRMLFFVGALPALPGNRRRELRSPVAHWMQVQLKQEEGDEAAALQELSSMGSWDGLKRPLRVLDLLLQLLQMLHLGGHFLRQGEDSDEESHLSESSDEYMTKCSSRGPQRTQQRAQIQRSAAL